MVMGFVVIGLKEGGVKCDYIEEDEELIEWEVGYKK